MEIPLVNSMSFPRIISNFPVTLHKLLWLSLVGRMGRVGAEKAALKVSLCLADEPEASSAPSDKEYKQLQMIYKQTPNDHIKPTRLCPTRIEYHRTSWVLHEQHHPYDNEFPPSNWLCYLSQD